MHFITFFAFLLNLLFFASASPIAKEPVTSPAGTNANTADLAGGVYACQGDNFTGDCFWNPPERMRACALLLIGRPSSGVAYKPRSIGPDRGGHCDVFKGRICNDQTFVKRLDYPGVKNPIELPPADWDTIRCYGTAAQASGQEETAVELVLGSEIAPLEPGLYRNTDVEAASDINPVVLAGDFQPGLLSLREKKLPTLPMVLPRTLPMASPRVHEAVHETRMEASLQIPRHLGDEGFQVAQPSRGQSLQG